MKAEVLRRWWGMGYSAAAMKAELLQGGGGNGYSAEVMETELLHRAATEKGTLLVGVLRPVRQGRGWDGERRGVERSEQRAV